MKKLCIVKLKYIAVCMAVLSFLNLLFLQTNRLFISTL